VLQQDQLTELKQAVEGLMVDSDRVLAGHFKPESDETYSDQESITNADELLTCLKALENERISRSEKE